MTLAVEQAPDGDPIEGLVGFTAVLRGAGLQITTDRVPAGRRRSSRRSPSSTWAPFTSTS